MGVVHAKTQESQLENLTLPPVERKEILLDGVKARVDKIHVDGLCRTKDDIIEDCIKDVLKASNFQDVLLKAHSARVKLDELGCFKNIGVFIDTSKGEGATPDGLEVTFNVTEYKRITGGVSTHVGNNEGALLLGMKAPNIMGRGEKVQFEYSYGSKRTTNYNIGFVKPFRGPCRPIFSASIFRSDSEWPSSGYKQVDVGTLLDFGFFYTPLIKHNIQWEGTIRNCSVLSRNTAWDIRKKVGIDEKSSLKYTMSVDLRDDMVFPTSGSFMQFSVEGAGLGGDIGFLKNELYLQGNYALTDDFVLQGTMSGGLLRSLGNDMKISLCDMYYLGGPQSIRGFQPRGVGLHSEGNALGGFAFWALGLHLFTPLPFRPGRGGFGDLFKTHLFVTTGNIGDFRLSDQRLFKSLVDNARISYGVGIALRLGNMARIEVNYCFPYAFEKGDQTQPGVQFGIGVQFV